MISVQFSKYLWDRSLRFAPLTTHSHNFSNALHLNLCVRSAPIESGVLTSLSLRAVQILYHIQTHLSIPFLNFFQKLFSTSFEVFVRLFRWNSFIISLIFFFVNTFLQLFSVLAVATIIHRNSYSPLSKIIQNQSCLDVTWMDTDRSGGIEIAA